MKVYKREGRRFVQIQDVTGMYLQKDKTFQKERDENSIGRCVLQTPNSRKVALFDTFKGTWEECKQFCTNCGGYMPNRNEIVIARLYVNLRGWYWTCEEFSQSDAWYLRLFKSTFGIVLCNSKNYRRSVVAFVEIPI